MFTVHWYRKPSQEFRIQNEDVLSSMENWITVVNLDENEVSSLNIATLILVWQKSKSIICSLILRTASLLPSEKWFIVNMPSYLKCSTFRSWPIDFRIQRSRSCTLAIDWKIKAPCLLVLRSLIGWMTRGLMDLQKTANKLFFPPSQIFSSLNVP